MIYIEIYSETQLRVEFEKKELSREVFSFYQESLLELRFCPGMGELLL